jgi:hypothetical protein
MKKGRARIVNPKRRQRARIINPVNQFSILHALSNPDDELAATTEIFEEFRGKPSEWIDYEDVPPGTPETLAELGGLEEIELEDGTIYEFDNGERLCSDSSGNLHIAGEPVIDDTMPAGEKVYLGQIREISYNADKEHLYPGQGEQSFFHDFDEDDKGLELPELYYQDGFYIIEPDTGDYMITREGIADAEPGRARNGFFADVAGRARAGIKKHRARRKAERAIAKLAVAEYRAKKARAHDED